MGQESHTGTKKRMIKILYGKNLDSWYRIRNDKQTSWESRIISVCFFFFESYKRPNLTHTSSLKIYSFTFIVFITGGASQ